MSVQSEQGPNWTISKVPTTQEKHLLQLRQRRSVDDFENLSTGKLF